MPRVKTLNGLTPKQERFCQEYLIDMNATQACIRAGFSARTADSVGSQLLRKSKVSEYLKQKAQSVADKLGVNAEYVLSATKSVHELSKPTIHKADATVALKALDFMGKHLKLWDNDDKKSGTNVTIILNDKF
jgi:phage terminase small subunit